MPVDPRAFEHTLGPRRDHVHVLVGLREEMHGAQSGPSPFPPPEPRARPPLPGFRPVPPPCPPAAWVRLGAPRGVPPLHPDGGGRARQERALAPAGVPPLWEEGL